MTGRGSRLLVTGGAGFIGCNLADHLAGLGHQVRIFDTLCRPGVRANLDWLRQRHPDIEFLQHDVRDRAALEMAVKGVDAAFHLAAQVAVTTSLDAPEEDFATNLHGTLLLIEALRRHSPRAALIFASTNKVYGNLEQVELDAGPDGYLPRNRALRQHGIASDWPLHFHTPYGCSKGAADQYVLDAAHSFGMATAVLRMSCIYGPHQMGTEDQGWVAHFLRLALAKQPIRIFGDGRQVRDVLFVGDAVAAYVAAWQRIDTVRGCAFNLGGGSGNAISLRQLLRHIEQITGSAPAVEYHPWRSGDQKYFVADIRAAQQALGLPPPMPWTQGIRILAEWLGGEMPARNIPQAAGALSCA